MLEWQYDASGYTVAPGSGTQSLSVNAYSAVATALGDPPGTPTVDSPAYDDDGNMLSLSLDGTGWTFTWDGENRLASAESGSRRIEYTYDYKGRRVERRVYTGTPGTWTLSIQERTLWHGWLPAAEFLCSRGSVVLDRVYVWGMDLSGSLEGAPSTGSGHSAGGVGGLLAVKGLRRPGGNATLKQSQANLRSG